MELNFIFKSFDHVRYQHGKHVAGPHGGAGRAIKVEPNINGGEGVTVTIYNLDGDHPIWQNNIQMAPKQMRVIAKSNDEIILRGFGYDAMGGSFADYGLTIKQKKGEIENCVLHMHDRGIDIEYLSYDKNDQETSLEEKLEDIEIELLKEVNKITEKYINDQCDTIVNDSGVISYNDPKFEIFSKERLDAHNFRYLCYFFIPVDIEDKIVLRKNFYHDTEKFRDYGFLLDSFLKYERMEYYESLKSFEQLTAIIESRLQGGKVYLELLANAPNRNDPNYLISNVEKLEDIKYLIATHYII
jgi:hypothetical protein